MPTDAGRQCTVSGGSGSTGAHYADLRTAADRLDASGDDARDLCTAAFGIGTSLPEKSAVLSPGSALSVATQITGVTVALGGLSLRMEFVARSLRWSATVYELTDATQRKLLEEINIATTPVRLSTYVATSLRSAVIEHPPAFLGELVFSRRPRTDEHAMGWLGRVSKSALNHLDRDVRGDPGLTDGITAWTGQAVWAFGSGAAALGRVANTIPADAFQLGPVAALGRAAGSAHLTAPPPPEDFEMQIAWLLASGRRLGYFNDTKPLSVTSAAVHRTPVRRRQLGDLLQDAADVEHRSDEDHSVLTVRRVVGTDGNGSWVVAIPGTTHWSAFTDHGPSDATANLATMAGVPSSLYPAINRALDAAMKEAGVAAGTEPVMLTGHSQGGIVATQLAADKTFRTKYDVREVVTAGSPIGRIDVPDDVNVLSLENRQDAVPHLDGRANPDAINRVQVSCGTPRGEQLHDLLDAHDASRYARSARELTADHGDHQLSEWYARNGRFLDGRETDFEFRLRRD